MCVLFFAKVALPYTHQNNFPMNMGEKSVRAGIYLSKQI